ncbi:hypothetical protein [Longimicrobium sp.]|uniref:hypothetical protein n=1 Tax=Longimicrobium sp. TaxID=2029185 RepID=UPI002E33FAE1|nr:hypothetical protein [Longimicrobium sp.]HEX6039949.1 hypothetical protein [Longimicrobium sp.]
MVNVSYSRALTALLLLAMAACTDRVDSGTAPNPDPDPSPAPIPLGVYEIQISGADGSAPGGATLNRAIAIPVGAGPSSDLNPVASNGFTLEFVSSSTFTDGTRGQGGQRYLSATYRVRNNTGAPVTNLTFIPVTRSNTVAGTPFSTLQLFNGGAASTTIAAQLVPTGAVALGEDGSMRARYPDVLQAFTEAEVAAIALPAGTTGIFPYGFVTTNPDAANNRTIPASADANDWGGMVTFAFRYPMQASSNADPYNVAFQVLAVQDTETRLTESIEEAQDTAAVRRLRARATALSATTVTVLNGSTAAAPEVPDYPGQRQLCSLRTAGTAATPTTYITRPAGYRQVALLYPGEVMDPCGAYFRAGPAGRPATNVAFSVTAKAVDLYGNVITTAVDSVGLSQKTGPAVTLGARQMLVSGSATLTATYGDYGQSLLGGVGKRNDGWRSLTVAGVTRTWTGAVSTDWHTAGNWLPAAVPMQLDSVLIPVAAPVDPVLAANVNIGGVTVEDVATLSLGAFNLTASANVLTGTSGGITNTSGRVVLEGIAKEVQGVLPFVTVTGTYSLSGNISTRASMRVQGGRLRSSTYRIRTTSF